MSDFNNLPSRYWFRYWVSLLVLFFCLGVFLYSCRWFDTYIEVSYHSGAVPILVATYLVFFGLCLNILKKSTKLSKDAEYIALRHGVIHSKRFGRILNLLFFPIVFGFPLVIGGINIYDESVAVDNMEVSVFNVQRDGDFKDRGGEQKCYKLSNEKELHRLCSRKPVLDGAKKIRLGVFHGIVATYYMNKQGR